MNGRRECLFACFLVLIAVIANCASFNYSGNYNLSKGQNQTHDLVVGYRLPGDRLVYSQRVTKSSAFWRVVTLEKTFNITSGRERITLVRAVDEKKNGATVSLRNGGPGSSNVTLRFKSIRGHGIHYVVELYAR